MFARTTRRQLRLIAIALSALLLGAPAAASAVDLRGEYAKEPASTEQAVAGVDLRGEYAKEPASTEQAVAGVDLRGEFANTEYRGDPAAPQAVPFDEVEPTDSPDALPLIVSGLVALAGFSTIAIVVSLRRRVRITQ